MTLAPICLFVYNRLHHTQCTIKALLENAKAKESSLYIFSDGPKSTQNEKEVSSVRAWLATVRGFKSIHLIERNENWGLAQSIITGVSDLLCKFDRIIVLEDDLVVSPFFLNYMNEGLALYKTHENVASIHGYTYPIKEPLPQTYFLRGADCWGWATWKRAWDKFESDGSILLNQLIQQKLTREFDFLNTQPNVKMLKDQIAGKFNSWAIRWHASAFLNNMLTLYPGKSLVRNIGFDNSGVHCVSTNMFDVQINEMPFNIEKISIIQNEKVFHAYVHFFKSLREPLYRKLVRRLKKLIS